MEAARDMGQSMGSVLIVVAIIAVIYLIVKKVKNK